MVNVSRAVRYRKLVKGQRVKEPKPVKVDGVKKCKVGKIEIKVKYKE